MVKQTVLMLLLLTYCFTTIKTDYDNDKSEAHLQQEGQELGNTFLLGLRKKNRSQKKKRVKTEAEKFGEDEDLVQQVVDLKRKVKEIQGELNHNKRKYKTMKRNMQNLITYVTEQKQKHKFLETSVKNILESDERNHGFSDIERKLQNERIRSDNIWKKMLIDFRDLSTDFRQMSATIMKKNADSENKFNETYLNFTSCYQRVVDKINEAPAPTDCGNANSPPTPTDCGDVLGPSGVYTIQPGASTESFKVFCDMDTDGGHWTVFQRRQDGSVDFYRPWLDYKAGFGTLTKEFWLGNDHIHDITSSGAYELRIDMIFFWDDIVAYAKYNHFDIGDESNNYRLDVSGFSGNVTNDAMEYHNGNQFSTFDRDNDVYHSAFCARYNKGGWWYRSCVKSNLNGEYHGIPTPEDPPDIVNYSNFWRQATARRNCRRSEMKMRRVGYYV